MSFTLRKAAGTTALALAATALALPLAPAANAVGPVERVWTLADSDGDSTYGLFQAELPGGGFTVVDESATASLWDLTTSADGSRLAYTRSTGAGSQIVVRDYSGRVVRTAIDVPSAEAMVFSPALSPDGNTVAWSEIGSGGYLVRKADVATGAVSTVISGYTVLAFVNATTLLVDHGLSAGTVSTSGGAVTDVSGLPSDADEVAVSPNGDRVAWYEDTTSGQSSTGDVNAGSLTLVGSTWTVGSVNTLSGTLDNSEPAFSRDGNTVYWAQYDGDFGPGEVLSRVWDASTPAATAATTAADELDVAVTGLPSADGTAPAAAAGLPASLNGTTIRLNWTNPSDLDLSGTAVVCKDQQTQAVQKSAFVPAPTATFVDTGLVMGKIYLCTFTPVDRAGNEGSFGYRYLKSLRPAPAIADPTSGTATKVPFPVAFGNTQTGGDDTRWSVDYLQAGTTTWKHWITGATGRTRTFGGPTGTNILATTSTAGSSYTFRVMGTDPWGNFSGWVSSTRAVVPFDQTKATFSGGSNVSSTNAYLGSYRKLWTTSSYARVAVYGNRLQVVGMKCTSCGKFVVYDNGTLVATIDTYSATTKVRQVLYTRSYSSLGTHTFVIRPTATAGRPNVYLDGFASRR